MEIIFETIVSFGFYALAFLVPLILVPITSEVFEFNKLVSVYILSTIIIGAWVGKMLLNKRFIFRKSLLDIPLLIFLSSQLLSTFISIDFRTSLLGYYSRFNGGFMSTLCYCLLYWAFVSNFDLRKTLNFLYAILASAVLVSLYGVLEHFGIDKHLWVQDVQNRVFSTLGQPNWLAAWLTSLIPLTWSFTLKHKIKTLKYWLWFSISLLFFLVLSYTKSRSGIIGFAVADLLFWGFIFIYYQFRKFGLKYPLISFLSVHLILSIFVLTIDSPWKTMILSKVNKTDSKVEEQAPSGPALEVGGTESAAIRKIVWRGAIDIWKAYPVFGSGVETFAFSYYKFRPTEHNLVSEWDYLYNKAHNEYLNYAATTGTVGLLSYLLLIGTVFFQFIKNFITKNPNKIEGFKMIIPALFAGLTGLLITNSVGFSVVPTSLEFFLFTGVGVTLLQNGHFEDLRKNKRVKVDKKVILISVVFPVIFVLYLICRYWLADVAYAKGKSEIRNRDYLNARASLLQSIKLSSPEAIYLNELAQVDGNLALILYDNKKEDEAKKLAAIVEQEEEVSESLSPRNVNIKRDKSAILTKMSLIDLNFLIKANQTLLELSDLAPTEPKIKLNLAISFLKLGQKTKAKELLYETIKLKANYKEPRYALAAILADEKNKKEAINQLNYILTKIDPKDEHAKSLKEELEKGN